LLNAQRALAAAQSRSSSSAGGTGSLGAATADATVESSKALVQGVRDIVKEINSSYARDNCLATMVSLAEKAPEKYASRINEVTTFLQESRKPKREGEAAPAAPSDPLAAMLVVCTNILTFEAERLVAEADAKTKRALLEDQVRDLQRDLRMAKAAAEDGKPEQGDAKQPGGKTPGKQGARAGKQPVAPPPGSASQPAR
jgi:hypothetical protein